MFENLKESNPLLLIAGIIFIPIAVAAVSLWVDTRIDERQRQAAQDLYQRQERLTVAQTIDAYFQGVGSILLGEMDSAMRDRIIAARTTALLGRLSRPRDRAMVVRFISQMQPQLMRRPQRALERSTQPFIDLSALDLSETDLSFANLYRADLRGADLSGSNLSWANLSHANLEGAVLDGAILGGAELNAAILRGASLREARIGGANFTQAQLHDANFQSADMSDLEFDGITTKTSFTGASLSGARWLDGDRCGENSVGGCNK